MLLMVWATVLSISCNIDVVSKIEYGSILFPGRTAGVGSGSGARSGVRCMYRMRRGRRSATPRLSTTFRMIPKSVKVSYRMQSSRVVQWKTCTQTDRQAQLDTQSGSWLLPV